MEFAKKDIALQVCKLEENMTDMIQAMKMWNNRIDVMELNKIPMPAYDGSSDDDDEFYVKKNRKDFQKFEDNLRKQFMDEMGAGMQSQMMKRFIDREILRRMGDPKYL